MENPKLSTIDELLAGTAQFDEKFYVSNKNGGYTLRDDILKKVLAEAEFRWNNGGKEIYEKLHSIESYENPDEFIKKQTTSKTDKEISKRTSFRNFPIEIPIRVETDLHYTNEEFDEIKKGFIPQDMDDRWFLFFEEDKLYIHRSWTGFGVYIVKFNKEIDGYSVKEFWTESNFRKFRPKSNEEYTIEYGKSQINAVKHLINKFLL